MTRQGWRVLTSWSAAMTGAVLAVAPVVATASCTTTSTGESACTTGRESLVTSEGTSVLLVLALPAVVALVPVLLRTRPATLAAAGVLTTAAVLAVASVGIFLVPTVVLAWVASRPMSPAARSSVPHPSPGR